MYTYEVTSLNQGLFELDAFDTKCSTADVNKQLIHFLST